MAEYAPGWEGWGSPAWQKFQDDLMNSGAMAANPTVLSGPWGVDTPVNQPSHVQLNAKPRPAPGNALANVGAPYGTPYSAVPGSAYAAPGGGAGYTNSLQHGLSMYGGRRTLGGPQ